MPLSEPGGFFVQGNINQIIGNTSGDNNTGDDVFFVGQDAGDDNIADDQVGIGTGAVGTANEAPATIVIGNRNYPLGMLAPMTGSVLIGHDLLSVTPRNANIEQIIAIGSGVNVSTSSFTRNSVFIGTNVAASATDSLQGCVVIGAEAGQNPPASMSNSTFIGFMAGKGRAGATSSSGNIAIGRGALEDATSPANTIAIGNNAMSDGTATANINLCVGLEAGQDLSSGELNVVFGMSTVATGLNTQDSCLLIGNQPFPSGNDRDVILGNNIDMTVGGGTGINQGGNIFIGNNAGNSGGFVNGTSYFVLEGGISGLGTPDHMTPYLFGDLEEANLLLCNHHNAVSGDREDFALGDGSNTFILGDGEVAGGGTGVITGGLPNALAIFFAGTDGVAGTGNLRHVDPAGTFSSIGPEFLGTRMNLPQTNEAATPTLQFGTMGLYANSATSLIVSDGASANWQFNTTQMGSLASGGAVLLRAAASATVTGHTFNLDTDTGLNKPATDSFGAMCGGIQVQQWAETGGVGELGFYLTAPIALQTGVAVTAAGVHAALVALGLITA